MNAFAARRARWIATVFVFSAALACSQAPPAGTEPGASAPAAAPPGAGLDKAKLGDLVKRYFVSLGEIPEDVQFAVTEIKPSQVAGLQEGTLKLSRGDQSQDMAFLISGDGRWFLRTEPIDLQVDPIDMVVKKIDLGPDNPSRGPADAKVTIVEYSDFQCPFCTRAETIVQEEVLKEYGDKVRFIYKQFPLTSIHPWAEPASVIGLCLFKQSGSDAYWKYHASVFAKQQEIQPDGAEATLLQLATAAGGDQAKIKACLDAKEPQAIIDATAEEAEEVGVDSTPTFFVNGRRLSGAQPLEAFKAVIDPELAKGKKS